MHVGQPVAGIRVLACSQGDAETIARERATRGARDDMMAFVWSLLVQLSGPRRAPETLGQAEQPKLVGHAIFLRKAAGQLEEKYVVQRGM